jgi:hypothetical protein
MAGITQHDDCLLELSIRVTHELVKRIEMASRTLDGLECFAHLSGSGHRPVAGTFGAAMLVRRSVHGGSFHSDLQAGRSHGIRQGSITRESLASESRVCVPISDA